MRRSQPQARGRVALVLAGGAARGAYEVGVVQYILEDVARALGRDVPLDILCGTSVGALNVCGLASLADHPRARARVLIDVWTKLTVDRVLPLKNHDLFRLMRSLVGRPPALPPDALHGIGLVDPTAIETLIDEVVHFERIQQHIDAGLVTAVTVTATHVGSGRTVVFIAKKDPVGPTWSSDPTMQGEHVVLQSVHALASAAIPLLFPAMRVGTDFYCDGGVRQNVPLSPARRLGADGVVVVSPRHLPLPPAHDPSQRAHEAANASPLFLLGKMLNALLLDRVDSDLDRLHRINQILEAGTARFGPGFVTQLNEELGTRGAGKLGLRPMRTVLVRASADIGEIASEFASEPGFGARAKGVLGRLMRGWAEGGVQGDLLSYLLFDGRFARRLIELGRADARRQHEELCRFFDTVAPPA
jgi:NTE family protein